MNYLKYIPESIQNLFLFKLRSLLTLLGVLVGTASVVALILSSQLATQQALEQFKRLGTDLFSVNIQSSSNSGSDKHQTLELAQLNQIKKTVPHILIAAPYTSDYAAISYQSNIISGNVIGATEALAKIAKIQLRRGRFISQLDKQSYFCVVGSDIAKQMKNNGALNPIGKQILVKGHYFTVVGVAKFWPENMFMYVDINHAVIIPIETSLAINSYIQIQNILIKLRPGTDIPLIEKIIQEKIYKILPSAKLFFHSAKQLVEGMQKQRKIFTLMLGSIGGISLLVGGIGVMNIMLVSVVERRREIGIRMALGARRRDIQYMFLTEAILLTLFGGFLGILVGILISWIIALFSHWPFYVYIFPVVIGFVVSVLVGIFFGYYPACKAAQLNPIEALRSE